MNFLTLFGRVFLVFLAAIGRITLFTINSVSHRVRPRFFPRLIARQVMDTGCYSLPVVGLTALFTGMVLALQSLTGFSRFAAEGEIPNVVVAASILILTADYIIIELFFTI